MSKAITKRLEAGLEVSKWAEIYVLVKFRLSLMVVASTMLAYLIAAGSSFSWTTFMLLFFGGFAVTGAANGINQVLEKEYDIMMQRTKYRPVAADRMKISEAVLISGLLLVTGTILLAMINPLSCFLGMASFILYAFVYTPLKRYSTVSVAVGAIPGALPTLIGVIAHDGMITSLGITLFLIQFLWQFPHFWAIAYLSFDDYDRAGFRLLPKNSEGGIDRNLGLYSALYSLLIIPTIFWAQFSGLELSIISLILACTATIVYTIFGLNLQWRPSRKSALTLMLSSFFYLPVILSLYLIG
ncbi:MAG: protoheme IX farnesyltransferase [Saprospiraceae bacterium]|nr:protoheme IX farnesyltransferase [Saprospiraceae bacterium]